MARHGRIRRATLILAFVLQGCGTVTGKNEGWCSACDEALAICRKEDDYDACRNMQRYCLAWCAEAATCAEACDGVAWSCRAAPLRRSTCEMIDADCPRTCETEPPRAGK